jgi:peptide/nickel transport system permease protein
MLRYIVRRIGQSIVVLFVVSLITFMLPAKFHSTIARAILGLRASSYTIHAFNVKFGFDKPIWTQYFNYMNGIFHGNFGVSFLRQHYGAPVTTLIGNAIWRSLWLAIISFVLSLLIAIPLGVFQAVRHNKVFDYVTTGLVFLLYSTPAFLISILLVLIFAIHWHVFPTQVSVTPEATQGFFGSFLFLVTNIRAFFLPVLTLTVLSLAGVSRFMRGSVLDTLAQDFIRTARAKGARASRVLYFHAFRNSIVPLVTILGLSLPALFSGALITELVFNFPGMGILVVQSTEQNDVNVVMAATLFIAVLTVLGNLIADISLSLIDPRVRLARVKG